MRKPFVNALLAHLSRDRSVFLTGDLGFMALEPLRDALGDRFINAGVAEQNMISVAAGLAKTGLNVWAYSIAPFCYARPFEQIRNDVCLHKLPVHLVGNGGGYGYGVMGSTHHALEDYGVLLTLPGMRAFVPAFASDLDPIVSRIQAWQGASYLRLGRSELPADIDPSPYAPWRRLLDGRGPVIACVGPLAGCLLGAARHLDEAIRPECWVITELPINAAKIPDEFVASVRRAPAVWTVEEHVEQGSFGQMLASWLIEQPFSAREFHRFCAKGYPSGRFGSQAFHRRESGIDAGTIIDHLLARRVMADRS